MCAFGSALGKYIKAKHKWNPNGLTAVDSSVNYTDEYVAEDLGQCVRGGHHVWDIGHAVQL